MKASAVRLALIIAAVTLLPACTGEVNGISAPPDAPAAEIATGRHLITHYGCGTCHRIEGVPGASGTVGPPLDHFYQQMYIAGALPNTEDNLVRWIQHPQEIDPGDAMPDMGVTPADARAIAAYLYHQPTLLDWLNP